MYDNGIRSELCTPTGAALLRHFVDEFGSMPAMRTEKIGYGMGKKDFEAANCVRVILGTMEERTAAASGSTDQIIELVCNIDDMTAEEIGFAFDRLFEAGAVDVFTVAAMMKKNRPGTILHVLCKEERRDAVVGAIFANTTTIGIREAVMNRYVLDRSEFAKETTYGAIRVKKVSGYGVEREKFEYDDLAMAARKGNMSIAKLKAQLR